MKYGSKIFYYWKNHKLNVLYYNNIELFADYDYDPSQNQNKKVTERLVLTTHGNVNINNYMINLTTREWKRWYYLKKESKSKALNIRQ